MWLILVINFSIFINFLYQYIFCLSRILCQGIYRSGWTQKNLCSPFSIDLEPVIHSRFWQSIIGTIYIKYLFFISTIPVHFIHNTIKVSKYYFVFISLIFIFQIILQSFKKCSLASCYLVLCPEGHKSRELCH